MTEACPFCSLSLDRVIYSDSLALALWDAFPVAAGHALVVPRRHIASWFDATTDEQLALIQILPVVRAEILRLHPAASFTIGINDGSAAGQTIPHLHIHVIPRSPGDAPDPTGGVRHVIPGRANYLRSASPLPVVREPSPSERHLIAGAEDPLLTHVLRHIDQSRTVDLAVSFAMHSGVAAIREHLVDLLSRHGRLRVVTGDYLDVTEPSALQSLLDLSLDPEHESQVELRLFRADQRAFHPKAYIFHRRDGTTVAMVGSSNLSRTALGAGIEWNYRVLSSDDPAGVAEVTQAFEALFSHQAALPLTQAALDRYAARRATRPAMPAEVPPEAPEAPPTPHSVQGEALHALDQTRQQGNQAGLVVLATGLGKTWLSAFDSNRPEFRRILFIAHREEILTQALQTYRRIRPAARMGFYTGQQRDPDAEVLFASVQALSRLAHLRGFAPDAFDYLVMDEFHHASAQTYRRLLDYFTPRFVLGLTATPDRTDGGDLLALCQHNLVYRCDIPTAIGRELLCPFRYFGIPDDVDYAQIPWRNSRFDPQVLTQHWATEARAQNAWEQHQAKGGARTLAFCCSTEHADFMRQYFLTRGTAAAAVHSGPTTDGRTASLRRLEASTLQVVFSVDMFSEGVDLPDVDTILMLRPTESRLLWLQQLGRGLRHRPGKTLRVIDYIGNHRSFLTKAQALLQAISGIGEGTSAVAATLGQLRTGTLKMPPGCEVTYDLEALQILEGLLPREAPPLAVRAFYEGFRERHGRRPSAVEAYHAGYNPRALRASHGSWLQFVLSMEPDLPAIEREVLNGQPARFLETLETTQMTKSYKMLVLLAMLNGDCLPGEMHLADLATRVAALARRAATWRQDLGVSLDDPQALQQLLRENPVQAWTGGRGTGNVPYFAFADEELSFILPVPSGQRVFFQEWVRELADWRLAEYVSRHPALAAGSLFCKVMQSGGRPILKLPDGCEDRAAPWEWQPVVADSISYCARFVKLYVNLLRPEGSDENHLPQLMRRWFGDDAGSPGTRHQVVFSWHDDHYQLAPYQAAHPAPGAVLWQTYPRDAITGLFGLVYREALWRQTGVVFQEAHLFLLVTLDKGLLASQHRYEDRFLSPDLFQWQSQNATTQRSKRGQAYRNHQAQGLQVHLFVRPSSKSDGRAAPFYYCGELEFREWRGEKPITIEWALLSPVPPHLCALFGL